MIFNEESSEALLQALDSQWDSIFEGANLDEKREVEEEQA
jgi:hypothetical protein